MPSKAATILILLLALAFCPMAGAEEHLLPGDAVPTDCERYADNETQHHICQLAMQFRTPMNQTAVSYMTAQIETGEKGCGYEMTNPEMFAEARDKLLDTPQMRDLYYSVLTQWVGMVQNGNREVCKALLLSFRNAYK